MKFEIYEDGGDVNDQIFNISKNNVFIDTPVIDVYQDDDAIDHPTISECQDCNCFNTLILNVYSNGDIGTLILHACINANSCIQ